MHVFYYFVNLSNNSLLQHDVRPLMTGRAGVQLDAELRRQRWSLVQAYITYAFSLINDTPVHSAV